MRILQVTGAAAGVSHHSLVGPARRNFRRSWRSELRVFRGLPASKQFLELDGTPVLVHTLRQFANSAQVSEIIIALRKPEIAPFRARLAKESPEMLKKNPTFVEGGEHRQQSVANGLAAVSASAEDVVLVHDAVRPFVNEEMIHE